MRRAPLHRGMTLLEAMLALSILSAATLIGLVGMGAIQRIAGLEQERLNGYEVAHRLLLNHMIDPGSLPDPEGPPIAQGTGVYRYEIEEAVLEEDGASGGEVTRRRRRSIAETTGNQRLAAGLVEITVRVYADAGGRPDTERGQIAELTRIYDPFDTDEETIMFKQLEELMGISAPGGGGRR